MYLSRCALRGIGKSLIRSFFRRSSEKVEELNTGLFGNELLKSPCDFVQLNKRIRFACSSIVKQIEDGREDRTIVKLFDDLSNEICRAADLVECVRQLHSDPIYSKAAEESARDFCELVESLNTYTLLYEKLKMSKETEYSRLDDVDQRTIDLFLDDFEQSGVHLSDDKRAEFVHLSGEIFNSGARFQWACDKEVEVSRLEKKQYGLDTTRLSSPSSHSSQQMKRKFIYTAFYKHDNEQEEKLRTLVLCRDKLARLTGFKSFAHRAQGNSLLGSYDNAHEFLWGVIEACRPSAEREIAVLMDVQEQCEQRAEYGIGEWDVHFLTHLYKERAYGTAHSYVLNKFLTLGNLIRGFGNLVQKLYGIRIEEQIPISGELWPGTLIKLGVFDSSDNFLGNVYIDIDKRPTKAVGDCHYTVRCSKELEDGSWQTPIVVLSLSLTDHPISNWKSLRLGFHSAENLFHEFGHAMHSMLGRTRYQHVAGTRCPQDFSEIPSNLMEYFFNDLSVMRYVLRNVDGDCISVEDAACLISSRFAFSSLEIMQQASYALFDLELHGPDACELLRDNRITTTQLFHSIANKALPHLQRQSDSAFQHRFHHLVQYGAKYYSYLVARSASSLIWNSQFRGDPFNREKGLKWAEVQSHGGGLPSATLLGSILGYSPTASHLIQSLKSESDHLANLDAVDI